MKSKLLPLIICALALAGTMNAQTSSRTGGVREKMRHRFPIAEQGPAMPARIQAATAKTNAVPRQTNASCFVDVIPIGGAPNALTCAFSSRSNISYNKDLNTIVVIHRAIPKTPPAVKTTGYYVMDISTDGGNNWDSDVGPIYSDPDPNTPDSLGTYRGRYPLCDIYNPAGNQDLTKAYLAYTGRYTSRVAPPAWRGYVYGTANLGIPSDTNQHVTALDVEPCSMENMFITKDGTAWRIGYDFALGTDDYNDTIRIAKGTFNNATTDFDYVTRTAVIPVDTALGGFLDLDIVFADDNTTGYIAAIVNNDDPLYACTTDTTWYISIYKTTDGGATWGANFDLDLRKVFDSQLLNNGISSYACGLDFDVVVDKNKNLHIVTSIHASVGYDISIGRDSMGMYDIYTTDMGSTWKAQLLGRPSSFRGVFGPDGDQEAFNEYARPFASRNDDGSKLFFGWFETDANLFSKENINPDLIVKGYDVTADKWTADTNLTRNTPADAACTFGNGAYYVMDDGSGTYTIPVFIQNLLNNPTSTIHTTQLNYIPGLCLNDADFVLTEIPLTVPQLTCTPVRALVGIHEIDGTANQLSVSGNYPNPFTGTTTIIISLPKPGDVTLEVSNAVGQKLAAKTYNNLNSGQNFLTIDCSGFASGLYFYKVKSGSEMIVKTMMVK